MSAWVDFNLSFVLANFSYIWMVVSDPFGWGWDLFSSAGITWPPYPSSFGPCSR